MIFRQKALCSLAPVRIFNVPVDQMSIFLFEKFEIFEKDDHIFGNQRDSKISNMRLLGLAFILMSKSIL